MASPSQSGGRRPAPANFLEALRELRSDAASEAKVQVTKVFTEDIPQALGLSGTLQPNESFSLADVEAAEKRGEQKATSRLGNRLEQERLVFLRSENDKKAQIQSVLEEIARLAKSVGDLGKEVQIASMQAPVSPGIYHKNFFAQLRSFIADIKRQVAQSKHWLAITNSRAAKRQGFFWGQAQRSGTKFLLSQERYMATTTG